MDLSIMDAEEANRLAKQNVISEEDEQHVMVKYYLEEIMGEVERGKMYYKGRMEPAIATKIREILEKKYFETGFVVNNDLFSDEETTDLYVYWDNVKDGWRCMGCKIKHTDTVESFYCSGCGYKSCAEPGYRGRYCSRACFEHRS